MADVNTKRRPGINFARILVEVEIKHKLKDVVYFRNEKGIVIEKEIDYEWKPIKCRGCLKYGYEEGNYRKKVHQPANVPNPEAETMVEGNNENGNDYDSVPLNKTNLVTHSANLAAEQSSTLSGGQGRRGMMNV